MKSRYGHLAGPRSVIVCEIGCGFEQAGLSIQY